MSTNYSAFRGVQGVALARDIVDALSEREIPTTPANYEIWASHKAGFNPDLSREIEGRLTRGDPFTDDVNETLFERYFGNTQLSVQVVEASDSINRELLEVLKALRSAGDHSGSFGDEIQSASTLLESGLDSLGLRTLLTRLASATRELAGNNRRLSEQMRSSIGKVEALQETLESVKAEALTDVLTGLANRRYFDQTLSRRLADSTSDLGELCLLLCDIDHFKRFNDTWGHLVGDQVIRFIANVLKQHVTGDFLAARYGGEEFALIMPRTNIRQAHKVGDSLQTVVRSKRLTRKTTGETLGQVTLSVGIAQRRYGEDVNDLISRADAYLYKSKRDGRDRITSDIEIDQASAA